MVSDDLIWASTKNLIAKGHWSRKKAPIWELFFVLNVATFCFFRRKNCDVIFVIWNFSRCWTRNAKIFSLVGCAVYGFIHWTISILLFCKVIIKTNKIAHPRHVPVSAKNLIASGPYTTKKRSHMGAFFRSQCPLAMMILALAHIEWSEIIFYC